MDEQRQWIVRIKEEAKGDYINMVCTNHHYAGIYIFTRTMYNRPEDTYVWSKVVPLLNVFPVSDDNKWDAHLENFMIANRRMPCQTCNPQCGAIHHPPSNGL
jgi:hypothetical protein